MKIKCIIIDDEPIARKLLEEFIMELDFLELIGKAENPLRAAPLLEEPGVDLIFLDINMPKLNGMDFLKSLHNPPAVIMTTAYPEHAVEGFALDVLDYLVKPISFERFVKACMKARSRATINTPVLTSTPVKNDHFFIKCESSIEKVYYHDLLYVEGLFNYIILHTVSGKMIVYMTLKSMLEQLPKELFIKVHKSYIVNMEKIKSIEGNSIKIGSAAITISQNCREEAMKMILQNKMFNR